MIIGNKSFDTKNHTYIMGILNITPDSFSDGGKYNDKDHALQQVEKMLSEGMDILDIGGESTHPGYQMISDDEEIERIAPVIEKIKHDFDVPISVDTYKSKVASVAIKLGTDMINDIWGLKCDDHMGKVIADGKVACCLMHNRKESTYHSFIQDVAADLAETINLANKAGISDDKIILDPGVGFAKSYQNNLQILNNLGQFHVFDYPLLLGTSRKSVIGNTLQLPVEERVEGTIATSVLAVMNGYSFIRVHDIKENVRAVKMIEAIRQCEDEKDE